MHSSPQALSLLQKFADLSEDEAKEFIKLISRSNNASQLLADYVQLNESEAGDFVAGVQRFVFASPSTRSALRHKWLKADSTLRLLRSSSSIGQ